MTVGSFLTVNALLVTCGNVMIRMLNTGHQRFADMGRPTWTIATCWYTSR